MKQRPIRAADLFCGSGGFSTGLVRACERVFPGRELDLVAVNHWQVAIDTHQANHPNVRHFCADLEHLKPRDAVPGGVLDILLAAPSCTYHSRARGGKPVYDQQRMDPWHVVRWCTELRVHRLIVENVPEFIDWSPCHAVTGRPMKNRRGEYFRAWVQALRAIGMRVEWKVLTCANYGDATTRERFFLYARSDKKALRWPEPTHTRGGATDLLGTLKPWRPAAEIIDWTRPGTSIFTRKRPLVNNTLLRLRAGAERNSWPRQHIEALQALIDGNEPRLLVTKDEAEILALQLGIPLVMGTPSCANARGVDQPIAAVTAAGGSHFAEPIIVNRNNNARTIGATGVSDPTPTATSRGAGYLAEPIIIPKCSSAGGNSVRDPMQTIMTGGAGALVQPVICSYYGNGAANGVGEPLPTQGTKDRFSIATPFLTQYHAPKHEHDHRIAAIDEPIGTQTTENRFGVAQPFLVPNFGERPGQEPRTHDIADPAPTIAASGHIQVARAVIAPCTHHDASNRARGDDEPLPAITGANRGELAVARPFVSLCTHGNESNQGRTVDEPIPTVTTAKGGEMTLATPAITDTYYIDILYRMLHWTELARATSFEDGDWSYQFTGTSTEITKQIGNAVPVRTGAALCAAILEGA